MWKKLGWTFLALLGVLGVVVVVIGSGWVTAFTRKRDVPLPRIRRATSPEAIARGGMIFRQVCSSGCHEGADGRASGKRAPDYPPWFGTFYISNITMDPEGGVGSWSDEEIARMIQTAIDRDGHLTAMPDFHRMGEDDVAAVIGFMRSGDPLLEPVKQRQPRRRMTFAGNLLFTIMRGLPAPTAGHMAPKVAVTPEYGAYLANDIFHCVLCHTPGFAPAHAKVGKPGMYGGGLEIEIVDGRKVTTPNVTFDATGIAGWSEADLVHAIRDGVTRDRHHLRFPMPQYRYLDEVDLRAIYAYLKTVPPVSRPRDRL
jgi:mono/diheme cytochrome c family protein